MDRDTDIREKLKERNQQVTDAIKELGGVS